MMGHNWGSIYQLTVTKPHQVTFQLANLLPSALWITWDRCQKQVVGIKTHSSCCWPFYQMVQIINCNLVKSQASCATSSQPYFSRFGPPAVLHSDQGRNFESILLHETCNIMGITKTRTTSYRPQCDGQTEWRNVQAMLSAFAPNQGNDWDLWLDSVTFAYNISRQ